MNKKIIQNLSHALRKCVAYVKKAFAEHVGIPLRTVEDWEAGRRTPPEYIPRLIEYQLKYEELVKKLGRNYMTKINEEYLQLFENQKIEQLG